MLFEDEGGRGVGWGEGGIWVVLILGKRKVWRHVLSTLPVERGVGFRAQGGKISGLMGFKDPPPPPPPLFWAILCGGPLSFMRNRDWHTHAQTDFHFNVYFHSVIFIILHRLTAPGNSHLKNNPTQLLGWSNVKSTLHQTTLTEHMVQCTLYYNNNYYWDTGILYAVPLMTVWATGWKLPENSFMKLPLAFIWFTCNLPFLKTQR